MADNAKRFKVPLVSETGKTDVKTDVISAELQTASDSGHLNRDSKRRFKKRWLLYLLLLVALGPYLFFRATSFSRKIQLVEIDAPPAAVEFDGTLRVATWNIAHGRGATFDNWAGDGDSKQERLKAISELIIDMDCLLYTSPSPRDQRGSRMPSSA